MGIVLVALINDEGSIGRPPSFEVGPFLRSDILVNFIQLIAGTTSVLQKVGFQSNHITVGTSSGSGGRS